MKPIYTRFTLYNGKLDCCQFLDTTPMAPTVKNSLEYDSWPVDCIFIYFRKANKYTFMKGKLFCIPKRKQKLFDPFGT